MAAAPGLGEMKSTTVDGARLAYLEAGPSTASRWFSYTATRRTTAPGHQIPALAETHRVLTLDLIDGRRSRVRPRVLAGGERDRLWRAFVEMYPQADDYTRFTDRELPLIVLEPAK